MKRPWFYILLSLAESDRYGSAIQEDVRALSDAAVRLWPATLYGSLEELSERGWIRQLRGDEIPDDGAGRERYYRLTGDGRAALKAEVDGIEALAGVARARLETGGEG